MENQDKLLGEIHANITNLSQSFGEFKTDTKQLLYKHEERLDSIEAQGHRFAGAWKVIGLLAGGVGGISGLFYGIYEFLKR